MNPPQDIAVASRLIKRTTSRCPSCLATIVAEVQNRDGQVVMVKTCPEHGEFEIVLAADARSYHLAQGDPANACGCGSGGCCSDPTPAAASPRVDAFETLSTCIALIEIVDSCNLACPACFASSPFGINEELVCTPFEDFRTRVQGVIDRKGFIDILQLSGGEPTLHPELGRLLEWALAHESIGYVLINTNAVRIAREEETRDRLAALHDRYGKFELYVQFDGVQECGQSELRGADLREIRRKAIDEIGALGVPSTLAMVVSPLTLPFLGDTLRFGLARPHCRGIAFQPLFNSGRLPCVETNNAALQYQTRPISVGDITASLIEQSTGLLCERDFTPLPCGDPNCHTVGYLLRTEDGPVSLGSLIDLSKLQGFLGNRVNYRLDDLAACGCDGDPLGRLLKEHEIGPDQPFRLFIKPFMDAWTYDQDRIDRCCTHVIKPDGTLDSFCHYYLNGGSAGMKER